jgi:teichuronic acid biosynthesis glycosyltransferase TuaG
MSSVLDSESMSPLVSVVIPTYQGGTRLREAVVSVLNQTISDIQVLVVDDGSTDGSTDRLEELDDRVRVIRLPANTGSPAAPRNEGVAQSTGRWVAFLDGDDRWHPTKLAEQLDRLSSTGTSAAAGNAVRVNGSTLTVQTNYFEDLPDMVTAVDLIRTNPIITSSMIVRRDVLSNAMPFPTGGGSIYEDLAVWLRVAALTRVSLDSRALVDYSDRPEASFRSQYDAAVAFRNTFRDFSSWCSDQGVGISLRERGLMLLVRVRSRLRP